MMVSSDADAVTTKAVHEKTSSSDDSFRNMTQFDFNAFAVAWKESSEKDRGVHGVTRCYALAASCSAQLMIILKMGWHQD